MIINYRILNAARIAGWYSISIRTSKWVRSFSSSPLIFVTNSQLKGFEYLSQLAVDFLSIPFHRFMLSWCVLKTERLRRRRQYIVIHARVERGSNLSVSLFSFFISSKLVCRIYWRFSRLYVVLFVLWFVRSPFNPFGLREWHPRTIFRSRTSRSIKYRLGRCRRRRRVYKNGKGKKERKREILHPQYINQHGGSVYAFVCVWA